MSSILRSSPVNILHFTISSIRSPAISVSICKDCFNRRLTVPHEKRSYSTYESPLWSSKTKNQKLKKLKRYTELLKVSKNKATHKKIFLGKLTANHVEAFAEQPGLVLGSLNKELESSRSKKLESNLSKQPDTKEDGSLGRNEKLPCEEFRNENHEENDCDVFGTLSNSYSTTDQFSKKSFRESEAYSTNKEDLSYKFGRSSNAVMFEEIIRKQCRKDHINISSQPSAGENNNNESGILSNVHKAKFSIEPKTIHGGTASEKLDNQGDYANSFGIEINETDSELPKIVSQNTVELESQKFVPEVGNLVKDYSIKKPDVKELKMLTESRNRIFSRRKNVENGVKEGISHSEMFGDKKDPLRRVEMDLFESYTDKKLSSGANAFETNEMKPSASKKSDFFNKFSNKPLSYSALHKLKTDDKNKNKGVKSFGLAKQIKSKEKNRFDDALEVLKPSKKLSNEVGFFSDFSSRNSKFSRNSKLNEIREINPFGSKQKPSLFESGFEVGNHWDQVSKNSEGSNKSVPPNKFSKENNEIYETSKSESINIRKQATETQDESIRSKQKEGSHNEFLVSYMDVCAYSGMMEKAYYKLMRERKFSKRHHNCGIKDIEVYNTLLHGYSRQGNWEKIEEILRIMKEDGFTYNEQTFAAVFDCLGRIKNDFNVDFVKYVSNNYIEELKAGGLSVNDVFNKTQLVNDQREKILSIIRITDPNYEIPKMDYEKRSNCELLQRLHEIGECYKTQIPEEITSDMLKQFIEEQIANESGMVFKIKAIHEPTFNYHDKTEKLFQEWKSLLRDAFIKSIKILKYDSENNRQKSNLYVYLNCLPVETFVDCMLYEVKRTISEFIHPPTYMATAMLGNKIWQRYAFQKKEKTGELEKLIKLYKIYAEWYLNPSGLAINSRQYWQSLMENHPEGPHIDVNPKKWPYKVVKDIGKFLYEIIIKEVKIDINLTRVGKHQSRMVPVFYTQLEENKTKSEEVIKFHPVMQKIFQACNVSTITFDIDQIPMVSPPKPWCHVNSGGYLLQKTAYTRSVGGISTTPFEYNKIPQTQLYPTFDSLNQLQSVPWKINERVLDVALEVFKGGGSDELNVPPLPDMKPIKIRIDKEMSKEKIRYIMRERKKAALEKINDYGLWCEALYKLSLANHFRNKIIWLPQNMDFRGRVYPVPPHITHLGADFYRSLFLFAKGKELGPKGLDWLKIHTINLTGTHKKKCVKERLDYANEILPEILDSAERPLEGNRWWAKSDEQWQTLAACMEIKNALEYPNPEKFVSRFPVHQDGSCNGLQHYAALGRDFIGAQSVNLVPAETPQDVYSVVVGIIERKRKADEEAGLFIAKILNGFISRKVIKQTIMTTVYGVTHYGAKLQIKKQLEDLKEFPQEHKEWAAAYLSQKTFESLNEMFTSAREIQDWFVNCASTISAVKHDYVRWVTPLGLPVEQPYAKLITIKEKQQEKIVMLPNTMKQKNAFPPNFIHSLDSSHMMLTSLHCEQAGITFASIHDCFWTHPSTVETMNKACREQFIALHSQPILKNLSEYFCETYKNMPEDKKKIFTKIPARGDLDLSCVMESIYFFS